LFARTIYCVILAESETRCSGQVSVLQLLCQW